MEAIHINPFRVLGLPIDASEKEIAKRVSDLEMYAEMGKTKSYACDFPFFSPVERTAEAVRNASNQIGTSDSRFFYSLFWFWNNNSGDDIALEILKDGNVSGAIALLEKQLESSQGSIKSFSSIKNLSILHMALARSNGDSSFDDLSRGLVWAGKMLQVDTFSDHAKEIVGNHFSFDKEQIANLYIDEILKSASAKTDNAGNKIQPHQLVSSFSSFPNTLQRRVSNRLLEKDFSTIDDGIEQSKSNRKKNPQDVRAIARTLCEQSREPIKTIRDALGVDDYKYQSVSDRLAEEIDQCGTEYYNYHKNNDTGIDPGEVTLKISEYALAYAVSINVQNEIKEGIRIVEEWIEDASERENQQVIKSHIDFILKKIDELPDLEELPDYKFKELPSIAQNLIGECIPELDSIKKVLGPDDGFYLEISSWVVSQTINISIAYANKTDDSSTVYRIFSKMKNMAMDSETVDRYEENNKIFTKNAMLENNLDPIKQALNNTPNVDERGSYQVDQLPRIAENLIDSTSANLSNLLRIDRKLFLNVSSAVANSALGLCVEYANQTGDMKRVLSIMTRIGNMEMEPDLQKRFNANRLILNNNDRISIQSSSKSGCYIATMVYGDYDAPQVRVLRLYRDEVMSRVALGRFFIKYYYKISPTFVKYFGRFKLVHLVARGILDQIIRRLA